MYMNIPRFGTNSYSLSHSLSLSHSPAERTEEDIELIYDELIHIGPFRHLSNAVSRNTILCSLSFLPFSSSACYMCFLGEERTFCVCTTRALQEGREIW